MVRSYQGCTPQVASSAYSDAAGMVIGDVVIDGRSSAWPGEVIR